MGFQIKYILENISFTVAANIVSTAVSAITNLIAPKLLGVEAYGYWQLYVLYVGYVGLAELGWNEGIYLKLGGKKLSELKDEYLDVQFKAFVVFQSIISFVLVLFFYLFGSDKNTIFIVVCFMIIPSNIKNYCNYILLATNKIKDYAKITILDRFVFLTGLVFCFLMARCSIQGIIFVDCIARIVSAVYSVVKIKPIFYHRHKLTNYIKKEILDNIKCGSKLLIANLASTLVIGIVKIVIGSKWEITVFSQISFTISITNMLLLFINAIGVALFPVLKTVSIKQLVYTYKKLRIYLSMFIMSCMILYFPLDVILNIWLPEYKISLYYMGMIFPLIIYETRTAMLLNTYYKALRLEKKLLFGNLLSLLISFVVSMVSVYILNSINAAVLSILFVLVFRGILLEIQLGRYIQIDVLKDNLIEILVSIVFIFSTLIIGGIRGFLIYTIVLGIYCVLNLLKLRGVFGWIKK
jgi:Polysaccharide biosynthesis protein.